MSSEPFVSVLSCPTHDLTSTNAPHPAIVELASRFVAPEVAAALVESCRIWARGVALVRNVAVDREPVLRAHDAVAGHACQFDALMRLSELVSPARLWEPLEQRMVTTLAAISVEVAFREGRRRLSELDFAGAIDLAFGRDAVGTAWVNVLAAAVPGFDPAGLECGYRALQLALQAMADVSTWKLDLAARRPSLVVAGLGEGEAEPARVLISGGRLRDTYQLALDQLAVAGEELTTPLFTTLIADLERRARAAREMLPAARAR